MREVVQYQWRTLWVGKWGTTRYHCTEEQIRKEYPEAVRLDHTRKVILVPETPEEFSQRQRDMCTGGFLKKGIRNSLFI